MTEEDNENTGNKKSAESHKSLFTYHKSLDLITTLSLATTVFRGKFFQIRGPVCQILRLTTAKDPHIVMNFLHPSEPDQICNICRQ